MASKIFPPTGVSTGHRLTWCFHFCTNQPCRGPGQDKPSGCSSPQGPGSFAVMAGDRNLRTSFTSLGREGSSLTSTQMAAHFRTMRSCCSGGTIRPWRRHAVREPPLPADIGESGSQRFDSAGLILWFRGSLQRCLHVSQCEIDDRFAHQRIARQEVCEHITFAPSSVQQPCCFTLMALRARAPVYPSWGSFSRRWLCGSLEESPKTR